MTSLELNVRIIVNGSKGVVKYQGPVEGTSGIWVGIDWDCSDRGKHDGTLGGRHYFKASMPKSGSFVREQSLKFGCELFDEIVSKYADESELGAAEVPLNDAVKFELVKMDKIHRMQREVFKLRCIVLSYSLVSHLEMCKIGEERFRCCSELDLSQTLVGKWLQIAQILKAFPILQILHLNDNRIEPLEELPGTEFLQLKTELANISNQITHLSLIRCRLSQKTAEQLGILFLHLEQLYLAENGLSGYCPNACDYAALTVLDLQGNPIRDIANLEQLFHLPRLEYLNLSACQLRHYIHFCKKNFVGFPALKTLILQDNPIDQWSSVSEIAHIPSLSKLILKGVPLPGARGLDSREMVIAKIPQIIDLDRCDISPVARRSAELLFLNRFSLHPQEPEHQDTLHRLSLIYDQSPVNNHSDNSNGTQTLSNSHCFANRGIQSRRVLLSHEDRQLERNLSLALPIHKIVGLGARLFGFDPDQLTGVELRRADPDYPAELLPRTKDNLLRQFEIGDGDCITFV